MNNTIFITILTKGIRFGFRLGLRLGWGLGLADVTDHSKRKSKLVTKTYLNFEILLCKNFFLFEKPFSFQIIL